jgi:transposase
VSWPTVQRAVVAHARRALGEPQPTAVLGLDETRFGRPRWVRGPVGWSRTEPWETGFVDLAGGQGLLGQVDGRTTVAVCGWLTQRSAEFRDAVQVVVIDPHAGYARAVRELLPHAALAVDHFHLVLLANKAVTAVRQRVSRELLNRRGRASDPPWANRRLLLCARERLSARALTRMWNGCIDHDPTGQILTA